MNTYTIGDDILIEARLLLNGQTDVDFTNSVVKAGIATDEDSLAAGTSIIDCSFDTDRGLVLINIPAATSLILPEGQYLLQLQKWQNSLRTTYESLPFKMIPTALNGETPPPVINSQLDFTVAANAIFAAIL